MKIVSRMWAVATAMVCFLAVAPVAEACPVCFQIDDPAVTGGVYAAVFVLLGVTSGVLSGFAIFIVRVARRAARGSAGEPEPRA